VEDSSSAPSPSSKYDWNAHELLLTRPPMPVTYAGSSVVVRPHSGIAIGLPCAAANATMLFTLGAPLLENADQPSCATVRLFVASAS
jgi:hypothetical protein